MQPTDLRATLNIDGSLRLTWKASNPKGVSGVVYFVNRRIGGSPSTPWENIAAQGGKEFTDDSLPIGVGDGIVQYQVQGRRGTTTGQPSVSLTVLFGSVPGGGTIVTDQFSEAA